MLGNLIIECRCIDKFSGTGKNGNPYYCVKLADKATLVNFTHYVSREQYGAFLQGNDYTLCFACNVDFRNALRLELSEIS